ncbi:hypothetical protein M407DRAFT_136772 [Tulasnella calospora MUT 4182]|uniref:ABM domain-containing protein n=1 Tax=Tulasnella calospora MUT 4182 TaxID=1051891 RepID=A0A0C3Q896_9AGAM|nr:hypothetical protein M407DRAFT_136772 [Tulasnella calospora MUT 4182]
MIVARVTPKPGKTAEVIDRIAKIKANANSTEPECLEWRVGKEFGGDTITTIEKYSSVEAFVHHTMQPAFQQFVAADLVETKSVEFLQEMSA